MLAFKGCSNVHVLLINMRSTQHSGAAGLSCTEASEAFLLEPCLNLGLEAQAIGRIHRIGQRRHARVTRLVAENTVDDTLMSIIERRRMLQRGTEGVEEGALKAADIAQIFDIAE